MLWLIAMPLRFRVCESWITWGLSTPHTNENRPFYTTDVLSVWQREKGNVHASFPIMQWVRVKVRLGFSPCPQSPLSVSFSFLYVVCVCVCVCVEMWTPWLWLLNTPVCNQLIAPPALHTGLSSVHHFTAIFSPAVTSSRPNLYLS